MESSARDGYQWNTDCSHSELHYNDYIPFRILLYFYLYCTFTYIVLLLILYFYLYCTFTYIILLLLLLLILYTRWVTRQFARDFYCQLFLSFFLPISPPNLSLSLFSCGLNSFLFCWTFIYEILFVLVFYCKECTFLIYVAF